VDRPSGVLAWLYPSVVIDTHCHLTFPDFEGRVAQTLAEARTHGVSGVISICTTTQGAGELLELARAHDRVWCSAGVHPLYADQEPHDWALLAGIINDPKCVAWGELGLDKHYADPPISVQMPVLERQLELIRETALKGIDKPIVIHCRKAFEDLLPVLRASSIPGERFVFHCFTGTPEEAKACLDFGGMISFTGVVTYKNAADVQAAAKLVPSDRIMVETDAPYLSPEPHRGTRPCAPWMSRVTAEFLAKLRGERFEAFHEQINANTERFFGIAAS